MKMQSKSGQAITEYLILTALIAIASIGIIQVISKNMRGKLNVVNGAIVGKKVEHTGETDTQKQTETIDMGDFQSTLKDSE